jgi:hypothetical protein
MAIATNEQPGDWFKEETSKVQKPSVGMGIFVSTDNNYDSVGPLKVKTVTDHGDHIVVLASQNEGWNVFPENEKREEFYRKYDKYIIMKALNTKVPHRPKNSDAIFIPSSYSFVKLGEQKYSCDMLGSATSILNFLNNKLIKLSSDSFTLKHSGANSWSVNGEYAEDLATTVTKLANLGVRTYDAVEVVKQHTTPEKVNYFLVPNRDMHKLGSIFGPDMPPPDMGGQGGPPMDPAMAGQGGPPMDPAMDPAMAGQGGAPMGPGGAPMDPAMAGQGGAPMGPGGAPMDPSMMQAASGLQDPAAFDTAAVTALMMSEDLQALVGDYLPDLEKALDSLGRILISLQVKKSKLKQDIGQEEYIKLESNVKTLLSGLGELVLSLGRVP